MFTKNGSKSVQFHGVTAVSVILAVTFITLMFTVNMGFGYLFNNWGVS